MENQKQDYAARFLLVSTLLMAYEGRLMVIEEPKSS
jgi:hypothetical protein